MLFHTLHRLIRNKFKNNYSSFPEQECRQEESEKEDEKLNPEQQDVQNSPSLFTRIFLPHKKES